MQWKWHKWIPWTSTRYLVNTGNQQQSTLAKELLFMAKINPWSLGFISESWHWGSVNMGKESIPPKMSYPQTVVKRKYNQWNLESSEWWELFCSTGKAGRTTSAPSEGHLLSLAAHSREHSEGWSNTAVLLSRPVKGEEHGGVQLSLFLPVLTVLEY